MVKIDQLKPMEFHFFETPNRLTIVGNDIHTVIIAELSDLEFDTDFCIDAKTFNMIQKLKTNRKLKIDGNTLYIASKEGKFKAQLVEKQKPNITLENFEYEEVYDLSVLRRAATFVSSSQTRPIFTGVLFNNYGGICGTDSFKVYAYGDIKELKYSIPTKFISLLSVDKCLLKFNDNKVMYDGDYKIISSLYGGNVPNINALLNGVIADNTHNIKITKTDEFYFYVSDTILFDLQLDGLTLSFKDSENEFKVDVPCVAPANLEVTFSYSNLITAFNLFAELDIYYNINNKKPILVKKDLESIIIMPVVLR